ncbi:unnamed protein product [Didymodactylos carnosus]|uniref:Uncharacterized protein n=1 Tax=Didymodactylos carnosus TaxID=1234261 RepID=A0A814CA81_9BILA|nr:unnamed protein product [Didymodactylos carnosus]CAF3715897.1 unnamed protein product [Didymodactylos carnosus]
MNTSASTTVDVDASVDASEEETAIDTSTTITTIDNDILNINDENVKKPQKKKKRYDPWNTKGKSLSSSKSKEKQTMTLSTTDLKEEQIRLIARDIPSSSNQDNIEMATKLVNKNGKDFMPEIVAVTVEIQYCLHLRSFPFLAVDEFMNTDSIVRNEDDELSTLSVIHPPSTLRSNLLLVEEANQH